MTRKDIKELVEVYSAALTAKGATPAGLVWPNAADLAIRFEVAASANRFWTA